MIVSGSFCFQPTNQFSVKNLVRDHPSNQTRGFFVCVYIRNEFHMSIKFCNKSKKARVSGENAQDFFLLFFVLKFF